VPDDELDEECRKTVERIMEGAPLVNRWHKQFVQRLAPQAAPLTAAEIEENFAYFATADYREGMAAFAGKRKPRFKGR
jgi:enoyl-CoA hydratase